ncbi:hypothetical protein [Dinghuibacter silviterrae]|uniref:Uncharacterized protein n=1 Tax=Dinghuibacter silviterrae TaxID=1539049 RepID=A0A4R8DGP9_9BACT|nr:hypothetical protein [Dinghuibacter silviterrae]TDW96851.1 hypothetical protein EDB95_4687 [Dinghuibacter silviterrae]
MKKIFIAAGGLCLLALALHIYLALKPVKVTPGLREMARIDVRQPMSAKDAKTVTTWLYKEKGIDHVLVNPQTQKVIFTYFPYQTSAQQITRDFKAALPYNADRFMPTEDQMASAGCPVAAVNFGLQVKRFFTHLF